MSQKTPPMNAGLFNSAFSRRSLIRSSLLGAGALGGGLALTACGSPSGAEAEAEINWANWTYYLDFDDQNQTFPTLEQFREETGIEVNYFEYIDDNLTFHGTIKDQLELDQDIGYDTAVLSEWLIARYIEQDQLQAFDHANIPNISRLITPWQAPSFDPDRKYAIPWMGFMTGVTVHKDVSKLVRSVSDLTHPDLHGKVGVLSEMRDTMGVIMLDQGVDIEGEWGDTEFENALAWLEKQLDSGQFRQVKGGSFTNDLIDGSILASLAWGGEVSVMNEEYGDQWDFFVPEAGGNTDVTSFIIPNGSTHKDEVEELINFYYQPEIMAQVADYVGYLVPVEGTQEAMTKINPKKAEDPLIFPDSEMESRLKVFRTLSPEEDQRYTALFASMLGQ